jgi:hypothetical protein
VYVAAVLDDLNNKATEELDWKHSIVDLMKLLSLDSSLAAKSKSSHSQFATTQPPAILGSNIRPLGGDRVIRRSPNRLAHPERRGRSSCRYLLKNLRTVGTTAVRQEGHSPASRRPSFGNAAVPAQIFPCVDIDLGRGIAYRQVENIFPRRGDEVSRALVSFEHPDRRE